jgi:hypothetical protein
LPSVKVSPASPAFWPMSIQSSAVRLGLGDGRGGSGGGVGGGGRGGAALASLDALCPRLPLHAPSGAPSRPTRRRAAPGPGSPRLGAKAGARKDAL